MSHHQVDVGQQRHQSFSTCNTPSAALVIIMNSILAIEVFLDRIFAGMVPRRLLLYFLRHREFLSEVIIFLPERNSIPSQRDWKSIPQPTTLVISIVSNNKHKVKTFYKTWYVLHILVNWQLFF